MVTNYGLSIVGAGRLGRSLGRSLRERGWKIQAVVTRSPSTAKRAVRSIGGGRPSDRIGRSVFSAPLILISVPDCAIPGVVDRISSFGDDLRGHIILHTSGALGSGILAALRPMGAAVGSFHPLQTFSGVGTPRLEGRVFAVEGDAAAVRVSRAAVRALGGQVVLVRSSAKPAYHAAASISAGMVLSLVETAIQIFASLGMKRREALRALLPLTRQVLENQETLGARAAWTGPLARGDYQVIAAHEKALRPYPEEYLAAYRAVNRLSARVLARDPENMLRELTSLSEETAKKTNTEGVIA
jgi:predicted short-subunit dehydrogenase-like oxidoreductase (DUF2520 family)